MEDKIYDVRQSSDKNSVTITSYFPLSESERQIVLDKIKTHTTFKSVFSDTISESEWLYSKKQIKEKFRSELFKID